MKTPSALARILTPLIAMPILLNAQPLRRSVPLRHWPAPLYWQPDLRETPRLGASPAIQSPLTFIAMTPCRVVDTRMESESGSLFGPPSLLGGMSRTFPLQSSSTCSIPSSALAYSLNITAVPPGPLDYITVWPAGENQPLVSTLNDSNGAVVANAAIVAAGTGGAINVYATNATNIVIDINGYYTASFGTPAGGYQFPNTSGTPMMTITPNGAVGIGTAAPAATLDVAGNINASGSLLLQGIAVVQFPGGDRAGNTSVGMGALSYAPPGFGGNTAVGYNALESNTSGTNNTAVGGATLSTNTGGSLNTAVGYSGLFFNSSGSGNTSTGAYALGNNTTGNNNTGTGNGVLTYNTTGSFNTGNGGGALAYNKTGGSNTAVGYGALGANTTGSQNTAVGASALGSNHVDGNTAIGYNALGANTNGTNNIAIGLAAASNVGATNSNNIHIGSQGSSSDSGTIRIGTSGTHTSLYIAGVTSSVLANGVPLVWDTVTQQAGYTSSSRRYKEDVQAMADASNGLMRLRPVTFRYQTPLADGSKPIQYGLIAEEVAEVYPDLVVRGADGQIETVKYQVLDSMLVNEIQKQQAEIEEQKTEIQLLRDRLAKLEAALERK